MSRRFSHSSSLTIAAVLALAAMSSIAAVRLFAQDGSTDTAPVITLSVQATSPTTWRPGGRGYFSWSVTDDKSLKSVVITTSPMLHSSTTIDETWKCQGKTSCEEKVYTIVPSNPGSQFVTLTATDSVDHVSIQTVTFDAPACSTDTDCGGSSEIQWVGATTCGTDVVGNVETSIMQYGIAPVCTSGICNTESLPRIKQKCGSGQMCTFDTNGFNLCIAQPPACPINVQITSVCACGSSAYNYPGDWRVRQITYCCEKPGALPFTTSPGPCPAICETESQLKGQETGCAIHPGLTPERYQENGCIKVRCNSTPSSSLTTTTSTDTTTSTTTTIPSGSLGTGGNSELKPILPLPTTTPTVTHPSAVQKMDGKILPLDSKEEPKKMSAQKKKELQLLKNQGQKIQIKIHRLEKQIASLERKIDGKLKLLDRSKSKDVRKRLNAQIDRWQSKIEDLERKQEHLETSLDDIREAMGKLKAGVES